MYKSVYNAFKNWYTGGDIFFYADPHFGDEDAKKWRNDGVTDEQIEEMYSGRYIDAEATIYKNKV